MTFTRRDSGTFTSAASAAFQDVVLPGGEPDKFVLRNRTAWGDDAAETSVESFRWRGMAEEAFQSIDQTVTTGAMSTEAGTTNGFRFIDQANPPTFAALATTAITNANPAVCTMAATGAIQVGSVVRLDNTTAQLQTSGYDIEVTAVTTNVDVTLNLDAQNFAAAATAGNVRLIIPPHFYPRFRYIMPVGGAVGITQATNAVVSMTVAHDFSLGEKVSFRVRPQYGMQQINEVVGTVLATSAYTITTDIDSTGFDAFLPPLSADYLNPGVSNPIVLPAGAGIDSTTQNEPFVPLTAAYDNLSRFIMRCGTNVVTSTSAVYDWEAYYSERHDTSDL